MTKTPRTSILAIRMTPKELRAVERKARAAGLPAASWARAMLLGSFGPDVVRNRTNRSGS